MLQISRALRSSQQPLNLPTARTTAPPSPLPFQLSFPTLKQQCRLSRRELAIYGNSCLLFLLGIPAVEGSKARAEEDVANTINNDEPAETLTATTTTNTSNNDEQTENLTTTTSTNTSNINEPEENLTTNTTTNTSNNDEPSENLTTTTTTNTSNNDEPTENLTTTTTTTPSCNERKPTKKVFFDISIDTEPVGRITIELYGGNVPAGVDRFAKIVSGAAGISYRRKEFVKIMPNYVQHGGLRSYGVDAELAKGTGSNLAAETLVDEWQREYERCPGTKNVAGSIGIIVRDPSKPPPKLKLVARKGKLEIDQEEVGTDPNGTEFVIATKDSPELDASTLVIGRVVGGMEVVQRIGQVKTVQENTSSPYFRVAKLIGDKRAVVAERGFNRPYSKVIVTNCGVLA